MELLAANANIKVQDVRGHVHLNDKDNDSFLTPKAYFTIGFQRDSNMKIPVSDDWFVISRAFSRNEICCDNANWNDVCKSRLSIKVWREVKAIIACPIRPLPDPANPKQETQAIGIISFDSSQDFDKMRWATKRGKEIVIKDGIQQAMIAISAAMYTFIMKDISNE